MKPNIAHIQPVRWTRKDKDGLYPVKIRITINRKSTYVPMKFSVSKNQWGRNNKVLSNHPLHLELNKEIQETIEQLELQYQETKSTIKKYFVSEFTVNMLQSHISIRVRQSRVVIVARSSRLGNSRQNFITRTNMQIKI